MVPVVFEPHAERRLDHPKINNPPETVEMRRIAVEMDSIIVAMKILTLALMIEHAMTA